MSLYLGPEKVRSATVLMGRTAPPDAANPYIAARETTFLNMHRKMQQLARLETVKMSQQRTYEDKISKANALAEERRQQERREREKTNEVCVLGIFTEL